jgi:acetaldehyde dehydrogenase (acetylating)
MADSAGRLKVAILGSGNIGTDLLIKVQRSSYLECSLFVGRKLSSAGMAKAVQLGVRISDRSIEALIAEPDVYQLVFDATSALDHINHWRVLKEMGKLVIDLTPARVGKMCVPAVNLRECLDQQNVNMVTCGGQASIPLVHLIGATQIEVDYIEVVSSISSRSAGPATRINIDEYVETTEDAIKYFSGCKRSKAILILNPAVPCIDMQTTVFAKVKQPDLKRLAPLVDQVVARIKQYVPGYQLLVGPIIEDNRIVIMIKVQGAGDYLPRYAGNLDIINCAAIATAEEHAKRILSGMAWWESEKRG